MTVVTTELWVTRAQAVHGDRYDYSQSVYVTAHHKTTIICPDHGAFSQTPNSHVRGKSGCPLCGITKKGPTRKGLNHFLKKAKQVHGEKYDYSATALTRIHDLVTIICPEHGAFTQKAIKHLTGQGCAACGGRPSVDTNEYIRRVRDVHGEKYDYSKTIYSDHYGKVIIGCPKHGDFIQAAHSHYYGNGCPKCTNIVSKPSQRWLTSIGIPDTPKHREVRGLLPGKSYTVDGFDPDTNTVYEFHGDYWHGNPKLFDPNDVNIRCQTPFGELYQKTVKKKQSFLDAGYSYVEMWESDWNALHQS